MIEKAKGLPADEVFLDLEDAVAPDAKAEARARSRQPSRSPAGLASCAASGSTTGPRHGPTHDVIEVVAAAGEHLDLIVLPKVTNASHVHALDLCSPNSRPPTGSRRGGSASRRRSRTPQGLTNVDAIAGRPARSGAGARAGRHDGEPQHADARRR